MFFFVNNTCDFGFIQEGTISTQSDVFLSLESLVWVDKGRGLISVGSISSAGETRYHGNLYPNTEYGLNRRMIRVTTIEVCCSLKTVYIYCSCRYHYISSKKDEFAYFAL